MKPTKLKINDLKVQSFITDSQMAELKAGCPAPSADPDESCDGKCFSQPGQLCGESYDKCDVF